jgi:antitoxin (DNA-binding transcriptional repressor) of toxin-antitoxin stability system
MTSVALKPKTELTDLVARAIKGENIVLKKGRRIVASIVPATGESVFVFHPLTSAQNARLDRRIARERSQNRMRSLESAEQAVEVLRAEWSRPRAPKRNTK